MLAHIASLTLFSDVPLHGNDVYETFVEATENERLEELKALVVWPAW